MPLQFDQHEDVTGEERRRHDSLAAADDPAFADARAPNPEAGEPEAMECEPLVRPMELDRRPIRHGANTSRTRGRSGQW